MCGIAGFYGFRNDKLIKQFSKELEHRGPDGEGLFIEDDVTLLNRRLAIIDVKGGDQPIFNEDKNIIVVYNGEIYNYKELRKELEKAGHAFTTKSDTEIIVHGYEVWEEKCFDRFNGMFGIALYDKKKKKLILARDHFGIKPLYYAVSSNKETKGLIFSSEIKPIVHSGLIRKKPNDRIIYRYLKFRIHDDSKETFFEGVNKLLPGEMLIITSNNIELKKYTKLELELLQLQKIQPTDLAAKQVKRLYKDEVTKFKEELMKAITYRLISEVPVGTCLSGGMDSSTVVASVNTLLKEHVKESKSLGKVQKTFSAVFPGSANDEEQYVNALINKLDSKIECHKVKPKPEEFFQDLQDFVRTQEEPTISTGPYAQYQVMRKAHDFVTVLLDGQGSDEMMAGYLPYYFVYLNELWSTKKYVKYFRELINSIDIIFKTSFNRLIGMVGFKTTVDMNKIIGKDFSQKFVKEKFIVVSDNLRKRLVEDIFRNSLPSLLRYEDKNAMRFSIEGRVPFLDFNLMRFLFSLDTDAIIKNGWNKSILRESTKEMLPAIINKRRNKIGFTTPEYEWFLRMKNKIYSIFLSESFANRKYFNQKEVLDAFQKFIEGKVDDTMVFWRMLNIELWMREFIDTKKSIDESASLRVNELGPNEGKKLEIDVDGKTYIRYPIKTELFKNGDDYASKIASSVLQFNIKLESGQNKEIRNKKWMVIVSEKVVAISQGRAHFIWDIKPSIFANMLSKFVTRTPYGIGLGSPWTMQLAIDEAGLSRILFASVASIVTKPFGLNGIFYKIAGPAVKSIDGPTEYSLYPSNVSAKLGPKEPQLASKRIHDALITKLKSEISHFQGIVIIDSNDIGRDILGNTTGLKNNFVARIMKDNPMGQSDEQTPLILAIEI